VLLPKKWTASGRWYRRGARWSPSNQRVTSCMGRRMCATAANLIEHVLPQVALRQWVLTFPCLRRRTARFRPPRRCRRQSSCNSRRSRSPLTPFPSSQGSLCPTRVSRPRSRPIASRRATRSSRCLPDRERLSSAIETHGFPLRGSAPAGPGHAHVLLPAPKLGQHLIDSFLLRCVPLRADDPADVLVALVGRPRAVGVEQSSFS
jgi:hypothetical protein